MCACVCVCVCVCARAHGEQSTRKTNSDENSLGNAPSYRRGHHACLTMVTVVDYKCVLQDTFSL